MDAAEDDRLENQWPLRVPATLNDSNPEVGQRCQEALSPSTVREVVQWEEARGNAVVKPLPFCVLGDTDSTVEVGSIVEMDRVAKDPEESSIRGGKPLQSRVRSMELLLREGVGHEVPVHALHVTTGGGCITRRRCTGLGRRCIAWCNHYISNGPSNPPPVSAAVPWAEFV
jgi:hypothetical protein